MFSHQISRILGLRDRERGYICLVLKIIVDYFFVRPQRCSHSRWTLGKYFFVHIFYVLSSFFFWFHNFTNLYFLTYVGEFGRECVNDFVPLNLVLGQTIMPLCSCYFNKVVSETGWCWYHWRMKELRWSYRGWISFYRVQSIWIVFRF